MTGRAQITIRGVVQGVGLRPFLFNLAESCELKGYVTNTPDGVLLDVEGERIDEFLSRMRANPPRLARIVDLRIIPLPLHGYADFQIRASEDHGGHAPPTLVSPDISLCDDCRAELYDPLDRRYLYPFINCTHCGPRYTITCSVPYDRPNTTMAKFTMCAACKAEYDNPRDRRFHAQPIACPRCGPCLEFVPVTKTTEETETNQPLPAAIRTLLRGGIIGLRGLGGFHIACDACNPAAVRRLRDWKRRSNKPFAIMVPNLEWIEHFRDISEAEKTLLLSNRRPIVLLGKKREGAADGQVPLADEVSPANRYVGVMLPYTPLHDLLFHHPLDGGGARLERPHFNALVMTSGNISEEPIVKDNEKAAASLSEVVDGFLFHDRDIFMRADDSVARILAGNKTAFIRRARGYAPEPIELAEDGPEVLACGADLKNTFTLTKDRFAIPSQHIGDMENYETLLFFEECLENLKKVYRTSPDIIAHDLHPGYLSTRWAKSRLATRRIAIQHHYAHIASVMAEHGLRGPVIGVALDGTGYGPDSTIWGGEFLVADLKCFIRAGHFLPVPLPGGEKTIREPWRSAVSFVLTAAGKDRALSCLESLGFMDRHGRDRIELLLAVRDKREFSPLSSSAGRLFDAVSAILGLCDLNSFEGEAAMALEGLTISGIDDRYPVTMRQEDPFVVDFSSTILDVARDHLAGRGAQWIATSFHNTVCGVIVDAALHIRETLGISQVALSGGTFQNRYLYERTERALSRKGFAVFGNERVPCNDGGISLGQAYLAREWAREDHEADS